MSPIAREILRIIRGLAPQDRAFGIEKVLELFVSEGRISPLQAHEILREVRSAAF